MATVAAPSGPHMLLTPEQRLVLHDFDWQTYRAISEVLTGRHLRMTYDRGTLELMTTSRAHGSFSRLLGRFVFVLAEECGLPISSCGDMTCDRQDLDRGVEPDECFYLVNEPAVRGKKEIDLDSDPPPDLVVEIDISRSSKRRLGIYAAMGVPEVWQFDGEKLIILQLAPNGEYVPAAHSCYFGSLPVSELAAFARRQAEMDEVALVRLFRAWVCDHLTDQSGNRG